MIEANGWMMRTKLLLVEVSNKRNINSVPYIHECRLILISGFHCVSSWMFFEVS